MQDDRKRSPADETNPFQSPPEAAGIPPVASPGPGPFGSQQVASATRRLVNLLVDTLGLFVLSFVIGMVLAVIELSIGLDGSLTMLDNVPDIVLGAMILLLYYVPQEAITGRTLGKLVTGTHVVTDKGGFPSVTEILVRTFARMIPFEFVSFFGGRGFPVGWHDSLSGTRVVRIR